MFRSRTILAGAVAATSLLVAACGSDADIAVDAGSGGDEPIETTSSLPTDGEILGGGGAIGTLDITITHPDVDPIVYTVGCLGDAFPVTPEVDGVDGEAACALLEDDAVRTLLFEGLPADQACTEIFGGPDEARIVGEIDGNKVDALVTRANGCEIEAWESLVGLIPPAIGVTG